jgi:hypothetical protein
VVTAFQPSPYARSRRADFKNTADNAPLESWGQLDLLGLCVYYEESGKPARDIRWRGTVPEFIRLEWRLPSP